MYLFLLQIILARRNDDAEGWIQILVFIVLAVFWVIGGIMKARSNNSGAQDDKQSPRKPAHKPPVHSREAREQMLRRLQRSDDSARSQQPRPVTQKPRRKFADLQAAVQKFAVEAEKAFQADTSKNAVKPKTISAEPQIKPTRVKFTEPVSATQQDKRISEPLQISESEYLSEILTDYSDPEELRRAILHYEILGRPLSLREPNEGGI